MNDNNFVIDSKLGRFSLFSIGCLIEVIVLNLCTFLPFSGLTIVGHALGNFTYPIVMIICFKMAKESGFINANEASKCLWGYTATLPGAIAFFFAIWIFNYYGNGLTVIGYIDNVLQLIATILIGLGLLGIAQQKSNNPILTLASYLLLTGHVVSLVMALICKYLAVTDNGLMLMKVNSIYPYIYNSLICGSAILFLFGLYLHADKPKPQVPITLLISSNIVVLSSFNLLYSFVFIIGDYRFGSAGFIGLILSIIIALLGLIAGIVAFKSCIVRNRFVAIALLSLSILGVFALQTEPYDIPLLSYLLMVSAIFSIIMILITHFKETRNE